MPGPATRLAHLLLAAGWLSAAPLAAQGAITGTVVDSATGAPIASALVKAVASDGRAGSIHRHRQSWAFPARPGSRGTLGGDRGAHRLRAVRPGKRRGGRQPGGSAPPGAQQPPGARLRDHRHRLARAPDRPGGPRLHVRRHPRTGGAADRRHADRLPHGGHRHGRGQQGAGPADLHGARLPRREHRVVPDPRGRPGPDDPVHRIQHPLSRPQRVGGRGAHRGGARPGRRHLRPEHRAGRGADHHPLAVRRAGHDGERRCGGTRPRAGGAEAGRDGGLEVRVQGDGRLPHRHRLGVPRHHRRRRTVRRRSRTPSPRPRTPTRS